MYPTRYFDPEAVGYLTSQYVRCGKPGCRCRRGRPHGPYHYLRFRRLEAGRWRQRKRYVPAGDVEAGRPTSDTDGSERRVGGHDGNPGHTAMLTRGVRLRRPRSEARRTSGCGCWCSSTRVAIHLSIALFFGPQRAMERPSSFLTNVVGPV